MKKILLILAIFSASLAIGCNDTPPDDDEDSAPTETPAPAADTTAKETPKIN